MSNSHLNYFRPYTLPETAENQLTRAALALMRLVPLAHNEFLRRVDRGRSISDLPLPDFDTQTSHLHPTVESAIESDTLEGDGPRVISVFLAPDRGNLTLDVRGSDRRAVFDGVVRYGDETIIVIESKLDEGIDPQQSEEIPLGPLAGHCRLQEEGVLVRWHELLASWQGLSELGVLTYSEQRLLEDFFDMAKQSFGYLLPFDTLARAAGNEERVSLRVRNILEAATGMEVSPEDHGWKAVGNWWTFERFFLGVQHDERRLVLSAWPGYRKQEARNLYGEQELLRSVAALNATTIASAHRDVYPLFSVTNYVPSEHQSFETRFETIGEYIDFWRGHLDEIRRRSASELGNLFDWLIEHGLASRADDWPDYEATFIERRLSQVDLHPTLEVDAVWLMADAIALDSKGLLVGEIRAAMNAVLEALGEAQLELASVLESPS